MNSIAPHIKAVVEKRSTWVVCLFLIISTSVVYGQMLNHDFVYFDDQRYVADNSIVKAGLSIEGLSWAFSTTMAEFWHPLTWLSLMLDTQLFGLNPGGYLLTNLLLHILSTMLLFFFLKRATGSVWQSGFVAALFALHPLHVESVAWIAQRKDVLSTFFWMLTILSYGIYVQRPGCKTYLTVVLFLTLGLMAKPKLVTLPFVLLLLDFWPLNRFKDTTSVKSACLSAVALIREKIPLFVVATVAIFVTYFAQQGEGRIKSLAVLALETRVANILVSYTEYIGKMLWPEKLACFYPFPDAFPWWQVGGSFFVLALISGFAIRYIRQYPFYIVGWLWYLGTLVPVIGFVKIGAFAMADRYSYVPLIGIFVMLSWGVPELMARWQYRRIAAAGLAAVVLVVCLATTWIQVGVWQNHKTLFTHAVKVTDGNYLALNELGKQLREEQRFDEAIGRFLESLRLKPGFIPTYINLGYTYAVQNKIAEAIAYYSEAAQKQPQHPQPHQALGMLFEQRGELEKAVTHLKAALEINPENAVAHRYLGNALSAQGKLQEAIGHYSESLRIQPANPDVHYNLGLAFEDQGKTAQAAEQYSLALAGDSENADAHYNLANLLARQQKYDRAVAQYQKALAIEPDRIQALNNLAFVYASMQEYEKAISTLQQQARLQADNYQIHYLVASLYAKQNQVSESIKWLETAFNRGFKNCDLIKTDQDLQNVRSSEDFDYLLSRYCN